MATKSAIEVVTMALRIMNVIGVTESADGDTAALATDVYTALHEEMRADYSRLYGSTGMSWASGTVPEDQFANVAGRLAERLVTYVPVSEMGAQRAVEAGRIGDEAMRRRMQRFVRDQGRFDDGLAARYNRI